MLSNDIVDKWRYERKFVISYLDKHQVESIVKLHPAMFSEIHQERIVNNIYLDTTSFGNYVDNQIGQNEREKIRIRWYGEISDMIHTPTLEIKMKYNFLGGKVNFPLGKICLAGNIRPFEIQRTIKESKIPDKIKAHLMNHEIKTYNRYSRRYFISKDEIFRITVDTNLEYVLLNTPYDSLNNKIIDKHNIILELKYDMAYERFAHFITSHLPFRMTKSSKYVNNIEYHMI